MFRPALLLLLPCFFAGMLRCSAQPMRFQLLAGGALSFTPDGAPNASYTPAVVPHAAFCFSAPLGRRIVFKTGLNYQQKGSNRRSLLADDADVDVYHVKGRYHFLSIPLMLSVKALERGNWALWAGGGFDYGFLLSARHDVVMESYRYAVFRYRREYSFQSTIGLFPADSRLPQQSANYASLYRFNPAVNVEAALVYRHRYIVRAFYEYNLYDVSMAPAYSSPQHMHVAGLSLGIGFR